MAQGKRLTREQFILTAKSIHGDKYDYSLVTYTNNKTKVNITCPKHSSFLQTPDNHLHGSGCPDCKKEAISIKINKSTDYYINLCIQTHGNIYEYDKTKYINARSKVVIFCKKCNEYFEQVASNHSFGQGCPKCNSSKGENIIRKYLIDNNITFSEQYTNSQCKDKNILRFDFFLPDYKLLIEFHGKQHYEFIPYFHKKYKTFEKQQYRDNIKRKWATENMNYLEISYQDIDNIIPILIANL